MIGEFSGHDGGRYYRALFAIAVLWNVLGTGALFIFREPIFRLLGFQEPVYPVFVLLAFGYEVIFGFGYWMVYRDMFRNSDIILLGIPAKLLFGVLAVYYSVFKDLSKLFLPVGLGDLLFGFLFVFAYFHSTQFLDRGAASILPLKPDGGFKRRVLVLYFSMTEQTEKAADAIIRGLEAEDVSVDERLIEPVEPYVFPFKSRLGFFGLSFKVWRNQKIEIKPLDIDPDDYDMIVLGSLTWWMSPSLPVRAVFNNPGNRRLFEGRNVAVFVVCRGLWQRNLRMVLDRLRGFGANIVDTIPFQHQGKEPFRLLTLGAFLFTGKEYKPDWLKKILYHYGLDEIEFQRAEAFGRRMAKLLT